MAQESEQIRPMRVGSLHPLAQLHARGHASGARSGYEKPGSEQTEAVLQCIRRLAEEQNRAAARERAENEREAEAWKAFIRRRIVPPLLVMAVTTAVVIEMTKCGPMGLGLAGLILLWTACVTHALPPTFLPSRKLRPQQAASRRRGRARRN